MSWLAVRVHASPAASRDAALAALFAAGSTGVQEEGSDVLITHLPPDTDRERVRALVREAIPGAEIEFGETPDVDWSEEWKSRIGMHRLGALTIAPPWLARDLDPATTIVIEPAMAFGTGEHPTTRGVVRLMQEIIRPGERVADLGAGSAVLSIAAAKLGAASVAAIELDPEAIRDAEENIERNGVASLVTVIAGDAALLLPLVAPVGVVLANILSGVLLRMLPAIAAALSADGRAILSGILVDERAGMLDALERGGWRMMGEDTEERWWSVAVAPR